MNTTENNNICYGDKYTFYYNMEGRVVICTTSYKGKIIRGVAKCRPDDAFDLEAGKKLAYFRCRYKYMKKKSERAISTYAKAWSDAARAEERLQKAIDFVKDTEYEMTQTKDELASFESELDLI